MLVNQPILVANLIIQVVEENSACLGHPTLESIRDIESDHRDMCRFRGLRDPRYQKVAAALSRIMQKLEAEESRVDSSVSLESQPQPAPDDNKLSQKLSDEQYKDLLCLLSFDQIDARLMSLRTAQANTCTWLLITPQYQEWLDSDKFQDHRGLFWVKGNPGTGKSVAMKFLLEERRKVGGAMVISFFFNARGESLERSTVGLYRSLLLQLLEGASELRPALDSYGTLRLETIKRSGWPLEMLKAIFAHVVARLQSRPLYCYVDALDECPEEDIREMVSFFDELGQQNSTSELRVCFSSRHYPEISTKAGLQLILEKEEDHRADIGLYIDAHLNLRSTPDADGIKAEILRKSSGIFLWVALVIPILNKEHDRGRIKALKQRLNDIPTRLHDLFYDVLTRDCNNLQELATCLQLVLFARRPLRPEEFYVALLTGTDDAAQEPFDSTHVTAETIRKFVLDASKGLAEITKSSTPTVQLIHESIRDFLLGAGHEATLPFGDGNFEGCGHESLKKTCLCSSKPST
jgi:hypothetical protein